MPNVSFFALPGLNHIEAFMRSDLVIPLIQSFINNGLHHYS